MNKVKKKDGISTIFFALFTIFFVAFLALILDIGKGYMYKQQFQAIADSASVAGANFGSEIVTNNFNGTEESRIQIVESKARKKVEELVKLNFEGLPVEKYEIIYNFSDKLTKQKQNILYGSGVLRIEVKAKIKPFIGKESIEVRSVSMARLTKSSTSTGVIDHDVRITKDRIKVYNRKKQLLLDMKLE